MTDTLIERMARALYDDSSKGQRDCLSWDEMKAIHGIEYEGVARFYRRARAALAAIRVPTERMVEAAEGCPNDPAQIWTAMIDAELGDG